jgi:AcrR family transcriptional regulator
MQADGAATRRRILRAATQLFATHGPAKASMRHIARESGVTQGTVHHYFGSKDGLYQACVDGMYRELMGLVAQLGDHLRTSDSLGRAVKEAVTVGLRFAQAHKASVRLMNRHILLAGEGASRQRTDALFGAIGAASEALAEASSLPSKELRLSLYGLTFMLVRLSVADPQEVANVAPGTDRRALEDHLGELALRMLGLEG